MSGTVPARHTNLREQAANICAARATQWLQFEAGHDQGNSVEELGWDDEVMRDLEAPPGALALARAAWKESFDFDLTTGEEWASAEALIRSGWVP